MHISIYIKALLLSFVFCTSSMAISAQAPTPWQVSKKDVVVIPQPNIEQSKKEAILILPGFGDKPKRRKAQKAYFENKGYDLFIPDFHDKKSLALTVEKLDRFITHYQLHEYESLHVYSYILGAWVLNDYLTKNGTSNVKTIIYDRSPLQERAPKVVVSRIGLLGRMTKGKVLKELSLTDYPTIPNEDINIGVMIECKATPFIKLFKRKALSYGDINWQPEYLNQPHDDYIYVPLDHGQMYYQFEVIGTDIFYFIENGQFPSTTRRTKWDFDPFGKVDLEALGF